MPRVRIVFLARCYVVAMYYISDKALQFVPCGHQVQVTLFA